MSYVVNSENSNGASIYDLKGGVRLDSVREPKTPGMFLETVIYKGCAGQVEGQAPSRP